MASIQERRTETGKVSYRVQVRLKGHPIERATFARKTDAQKWAQATEAAIRERRYFKTSEARKHTVEELIDRYLSKVEREAPHRIRDQYPMLQWWKAELGRYSLADLSRALISEKIEKLFQRTVRRINKETEQSEHVPISVSRVNRYISTFSKACSVAVNEWEWLEDNPLRKIRRMKEPSGRIRFLDDEERSKLLLACKEAPYEHLYTIVVLALSTGARRGEILNLRWADIDIERGQIVLHETKNGERRVIPLNGHAYNLIVEHRKTRRTDTELLFPSQKGDKPYEIKRSWEGAIAKAGIDDFKFHDLRHSAASYLAMNGATLAEIADVLGHKTLQMVKRYAHLSDAHTSAVVGRMNNRIFEDVG